MRVAEVEAMELAADVVAVGRIAAVVKLQAAEKALAPPLFDALTRQ